MNLLVIIGATGTGKSTLAHRLSDKKGLPVVDLDDLAHLPGWVSRAPEEFLALGDVETQKDKWIVVGNYRILRDVIWSRADTVVWLDYSFPLTFWRLLSRSVQCMTDKREVCNGNVETWRMFLSRDSIVVWLFQSFWRRKRDFGEIFDNPRNWSHIRFVRLRSPAAAQKWLESLS